MGDGRYEEYYWRWVVSLEGVVSGGGLGHYIRSGI
jgi:hypothetical protein